MLKSTRKEDPAPYPARPPLQLLENPENVVLCEAIPKNVFVDCDEFLSLLEH